MKRTSEERFKILISTLKRYERACEFNNAQGLDHTLSNVRYLPSQIKIDLKNGRTFELNGHVVRLAGFEIKLESIMQVHWITFDNNTLEKASLKKVKFDRIYLQTNQELILIEGMGQSVFPVLQFIEWVIKYG